MRKITLITAVIALFACSNTDTLKSIKGTILDATMNTMTLLNDTDTLYFNTMDAEKVTTDGILIGDSVEIFYKGELSTTVVGNICPAIKMIVTPISLQGEWVEPIPGMDGVQGINLKADGTASSINMATLVYDSWTKDGNRLYISGKSIGNGQTIQFNQIWNIDTLTPDSLVISADSLGTLRYARMK